MTPLNLHDTFQFACSDKVPCFNECCRDLNQFLTPYDILRLKNHLALHSSDFLNRFTSCHIGPGSGLPVITLKMTAESDFKCPFVTPNGCRVYPDRPASCRMYPVARAVSRSRETGQKQEHFMLIREPHCRGFEQNARQTVQDWLHTQGLTIYNKMNDQLMEIISLKNQIIPGTLDQRAASIFHLACYDLDTFRNRIFNDGLLESVGLHQTVMDAIQSDDTALMQVGLAWVKDMLFGRGMPSDPSIIES
jgi:hypothetical protein